MARDDLNRNKMGVGGAQRQPADDDAAFTAARQAMATGCVEVEGGHAGDLLVQSIDTLLHT